MAVGSTKCTYCGAPVTHGKNQCEYCGGEIARPNTPPPNYNPPFPNMPNGIPGQLYGNAPRPYYAPLGRPNIRPKNRVTAAVLAIILGALGVHKFYLNRNGWGVLYLMTTAITFGFGGIFIGLISFIEGIVLLCMSDEAFAYKYNS